VTEGQQNMAVMAIICLKMNFKGVSGWWGVIQLASLLYDTSWKLMENFAKGTIKWGCLLEAWQSKVSSQTRRNLDGGPKHSSKRCASFGIKRKATYLQAPAFLTLLILLSVRRILAYLSCQNYDETYSVCQLA
jgi:hypothetical protein